METCDLSRLGPIEFERLVRALCFKIMGPKGIVYSSGPDGGRDFTYDGPIKGYDEWDGYLVVQAKFREKMSPSSDDLDWLKTQIETEYREFIDQGNRRPPKYYILATNIRLSGADGFRSRKKKQARSGGYSKTLKLFDKWKSDLKVEQIDIWPYDKIVDLLISQPEIRHAYAAWVTPGDVLTKVFEHFHARRPDFKDVISRSLKILLHKDQFVRLKDAGSVGDVQIRTSQVFVDLPLVLAPAQKRLNLHQSKTKDNDEQRLLKRNFHAISALVERSREKLDPETLISEEERAGNDERRAQRNRIVLIGGPGQGKSTASLFLTQIFRSTLLEKQLATRRDQNVKHLVPEILSRAGAENIARDVPHRYPIHVALPRFADSISASRLTDNNSPCPSLLSHISGDIASSCDQEVDRSDVRNWLRSHPWVVVLDGLDEVPPSGERPAVLDAISNFFTEVSEVNADVLVVVTTRPQGYNKDFDEKVWQHWKLADLNTDQALSYAGAFGLARYPDDTQRRSEIHALLQKAAVQPATARLMISPLQVTILHFIVDTGGGVPTARWTLFNEYFEVLKRREKAKGGETQKILERYWQQLGPIHHRAGLVLQTDSEHSGGAGSRLTHERFRALVQSYLTSEGHSAEEAQKRVEELMTVALHRLVLLSTQEEGAITFDVRSLQEFMAAAALTSEDQSVMESRLAHVAGRSHWRHVFLIAASRCFADDSFHYRRAVVTAIPRQLDSIEPDMFGRNGARLALDLLVDGVGLDHPNSRRPLLQHALENLVLGPDSVDLRLAEVGDDQTLDLLQHAIVERIAEGATAPAIAAWALLLRLEQLGHQWAYDLIVAHWPRRPGLLLSIMKNCRPPFANQGMVRLFYDAVIILGPETARSELFPFFHSLQMEGHKNLDYTLLKDFGSFRFYFGDRRLDDQQLRSKIAFAGVSQRVTVIPVDAVEFYRGYDRSEFLTAPWSGFRAAAHFVANPSKNTLAQALRMLAEVDFASVRELRRELPWPIASIIDEVATPSDLLLRAIEVEGGDKGDTEDWMAAQKRWTKSGITANDLEIALSGVWFDRHVGRVGAPFFRYGGSSDHGDSPQTLASALVSLCGKIKNESIRETISELAFQSLVAFRHYRRSPVAPKQFLELMIFAKFSYLYTDIVASWPETVWSDAEMVSLLRRTSANLSVTHNPDFGDAGPLFRNAFSNFPQERELLYPLAVATLEHDQTTQADLEKLPESAFLSALGDSMKTQAACLVLSLARFNESTPSVNVVRCVEKVIQLEDCGLELAKRLLESDILPIEQQLFLVARLMKLTSEAGNSGWRMFVPAMHKALDRRKSGLSLKDVWIHKLKLPNDSFQILLPSV